MSGGVDSSVAAYLLKQQGHDVVGISMQLHDISEGENGRFDSCCSLDDFADARRVCTTLGIPFYIMNYEAEFKSQVIDPFIREYRAGRTPNPCALCNTWLKFDHLVAHAAQLEADFVATGHYARREEYPDGTALLRGVDAGKDQSYFLFGLTRPQLDKALFPLGGLTKPEVRELARKAGLRTAEKHESQEICFVTDNDYASFVTKSSGPMPIGEIVDTAGRVLGAHNGIHHFTVGQRKGLGIAAAEPLYVREIDAATNRVVVGRRDELSAAGLEASRVNWIAAPAEREATVKIRYRHAGLRAMLHPGDDGTVSVRFLDKCEAVTPGQAAVFYDGDRVLGGGWIDRPIWSEA
jgi:tRNA-specific 2-thiouridylase